MPVANPAIVLIAAVALALSIGRFPDRANPITALAALARSAVASSGLTGAAASVAGLGLVGSCCVAAVMMARVLADGLPLMLMALVPWQAANAVKTVLCALLLWCALSAPGSAFWRRGSGQASALALSREAVAPLVLFTLWGGAAALAWAAAVAAVHALPEEWAACARRIVALAHYPAARIAALAACVAAPFVGGRSTQAWPAVLKAPESGDLWHPEWVAAALDQIGGRTGRLAIAAVLVVVAGCLAAMAVPLALR